VYESSLSRRTHHDRSHISGRLIAALAMTLRQRAGGSARCRRHGLDGPEGRIVGRITTAQDSASSAGRRPTTCQGESRGFESRRPLLTKAEAAEALNVITRPCDNDSLTSQPSECVPRRAPKQAHGIRSMENAVGYPH